MSTDVSLSCVFMLRSRENCYFSFSSLCKLPSFEQHRESCQPGCPWAGPPSPLRSPGCFCQHDPWLLPLLVRVAPPSSGPSLGAALFTCESHSFPFITLLLGFKFFTVSIPNMGCMSRCCPKFGPLFKCSNDAICIFESQQLLSRVRGVPQGLSEASGLCGQS